MPEPRHHHHAAPAPAPVPAPVTSTSHPSSGAGLSLHPLSASAFSSSKPLAPAPAPVPAPATASFMDVSKLSTELMCDHSMQGLHFGRRLRRPCCCSTSSLSYAVVIANFWSVAVGASNRILLDHPLPRQPLPLRLPHPLRPLLRPRPPVFLISASALRRPLRPPPQRRCSGTSTSMLLRHPCMLRHPRVPRWSSARLPCRQTSHSSSRCCSSNRRPPVRPPHSRQVPFQCACVSACSPLCTLDLVL